MTTTSPSAADLVAALLTIPDQLARIEQLVTTARPVAVTEAPSPEAAEVVLVPESWSVIHDGVDIGTLYGKLHYTCTLCGWGIGCAGGDSDDLEEDLRIADQIEQAIADHEQEHREEAAKSPAESWPEGIAVEPYAHIIRRGDHGIGMVYHMYHSPDAPGRVVCWECETTHEIGHAPDLREGVALLLAHIEAEHGEQVTA